jgi:hypothetical protein
MPAPAGRLARSNAESNRGEFSALTQSFFRILRVKREAFHYLPQPTEGDSLFCGAGVACQAFHSRTPSMRACVCEQFGVSETSISVAL